MRANPLLPQADLLPAAATSKSSSSDVTGPSFNQFLSNEVSSPKNNPAPASNQNNVNNNSSANNSANNNNNVNNNNDNSANNQVDSKAPDKPAQATGSKTDKPKDAKDKDDDADSTQAAGSGDQTPAGQIIALVENLGKLTAGNAAAAGKGDDKKVDLSAVAGAINSAMLDKSKQLDAKIGPDVTADAADAKTLKAKTPDFKTDADLAGKKLANALPTDKGDVKDKADTTKPVDVAAAKDASANAAKDAQLRAPAEAVAGADQKLQAAQDLAASKALMQDGAAAVAPVQQNFAQQLAATATQANSAADAEHLSPRVGSPGWDQAVGQKVVWMVAGGKQTAELTLNPPDLGPMQVVLSVNNDKATATFVTAQPEVRDALESAMPKLRQMMSDAGVQLSGFSVSTQSSNQGGQFSGNTPSNSRRSSHGLSGPDTGPISSVSGTTASTTVRTGKLGMVDTFA
ncbi:flagellar hook-length control protein FliK [Undibacterium sp. TJN25]|uniref:flagellar hook-length control protein FliK n=1 Tax=Undibacterium sp. TJN25 TaxID=3413056 RepID=UPI003BF312D5